MSVPDARGPGVERMLEQGALEIEIAGSVVRLRGELDMEGAALLEDQLIELMAGQAPSVVVDLRELQFIDSTGLQSLMRATLHSRENGDKLCFLRGSGQVAGVMRLTRVSEMLPFVD